MQRMSTAVVLMAAVAVIAGCGGSGPTPPPPVQIVGSYLGHGIMSAYDQPVLQVGLVVRSDRTVGGAAFFSGPIVNRDAFFTGAVDASNNLTASGRLIGNSGTEDVGSFTLTGTFDNFLDGSNVAGTFTAEGVGSGQWFGFLYDIYPLGTYMGGYTGDSEGRVAIMNFLVDDIVVMIDQTDAPRVDWFASDIGSAMLTPPPQPGASWGINASDGLYGTGFSLSGGVGQTEAGGIWQQAVDTTTLSGAWSATKPHAGAAAAARGSMPPGPIRVRRVRP
ncbi:MAG: hypothetical protein JSV65_13885 [Armatimonadota bacterium]|nr:MAG: hypothetical protein JSV65_13885 [Armatimonadota bacterium]